MAGVTLRNIARNMGVTPCPAKAGSVTSESTPPKGGAPCYAHAPRSTSTLPKGMTTMNKQNDVLRPVIGKPELRRVARRLVALYEASRAALADRASLGGTPTPVDLSAPIPSRLDCVTDRVSGLDYAAWCIGEAIASCAGLDGLHMLYGLFEDMTDARASSWLDHRWNGVATEDGFVWTA